ncbi:hypothetical protein MPTK2_3g14520 [Marchantia polymorpha subsp. ruderalis]
MAKPNPGASQGINKEEPFLKAKILKDDKDIRLHYRKQQKLGEGSYGGTFAVVDRRNPVVRLAMKVQTKSCWGSPEEEALRLFRELLILNRILPKHPNIAQMKDMLIGPHNVYILQELCSQETLEHFYPVANGVSGCRIFKQLIDAFNVMHQHGVVHWDVRESNILFAHSDFMQCKIIDFGQSAYRPEWATKVNDNFDPRNWFTSEELAPPPDPNAPHVPKKVDDVRKLGRILHCIMAGKYVPHTLLGSDAAIQMKTIYRPRVEVFGAQAVSLLRMIGPPPFGPARDEDLPTIDKIHQHMWLV